MANRPRKSPQAELDVTLIWQFIANDSVKSADIVLDRIEATFGMLADNALAGRRRDDLVPNLRSFPVGNHVIFYLPLADGIEVIRVMHGRQDIDADDMA
jgi:toxin ParE1/3/4